MSSETYQEPLEKFLPDFVNILRMRNFIVNDIKSANDTASEELNGFLIKNHLLEEGQQLRVTYPHGMGALVPYLQDASGQGPQAKDVWIVGFFGFKYHEDIMQANIVQEIWKVDDTLVKGMPAQPNLLCYVSMEKVAKGDWCNFVVLRSPDGVAQWKQAPGHEHAVK